MNNPSSQTLEVIDIVRSGNNFYRCFVLTWFIGFVDLEHGSTATEDREGMDACKAVKETLWFDPRLRGWY